MDGRGLKFKCIRCGSRQKDVRCLEAHICSAHLNYLPYECCFCNFVRLPTEFFFFQHFEKLHPGAPCKVLFVPNKELNKELYRCMMLSGAERLLTVSPPATPPIRSEPIDNSARKDTGGRNEGCGEGEVKGAVEDPSGVPESGTQDIPSVALHDAEEATDAPVPAPEAPSGEDEAFVRAYRLLIRGPSAEDVEGEGEGGAESGGDAGTEETPQSSTSRRKRKAGRPTRSTTYVGQSAEEEEEISEGNGLLFPAGLVNGSRTGKIKITRKKFQKKPDSPSVSSSHTLHPQDAAKIPEKSVNPSGFYSSEENIHVCQVCGKGFARAGNLERHIKAAHKTSEAPEGPSGIKGTPAQGREREFKCGYCEESFSAIRDCQAHERTHPDGKRRHQCAFCDQKFHRLKDCRRHERTHTGERPYKCHYCVRNFTQPGALRSHEWAVHTKDFPHVCPECGKGYAVPCRLKKHMESEHRDMDIY